MSTRQYLQANLVERGKFILEEVEEPKLKVGEVLIQVAACGICGSDIHAYHGKHPFMKWPLVMGHEFAGVVEKRGVNVKNFQQGQRVIVEPLLSCGACYNCMQGRYNLCDSLRVMGCQTTGAYAEKIVVPQERIVLLPDNISYIDGTLIEPASVACHAVRRANPKRDERALIFGAGPIGLFTLQMLKAFGIGEVGIVEMDEYRMKVASDLGVDYIVNAHELKKYLENTSRLHKIDIFFDCVGADAAAFNEAINLARRGTRIISIGIFQSGVRVENLAFLSEHELEVIGSFTYLREDFTKTVQLMTDERINTDGIVTHRVKLKEIEEAFKLIDDRKEEVIKVVIEMDDVTEVFGKGGKFDHAV